MGFFTRCRECHRRLPEHHQDETGLCDDHGDLAADYCYYDALRAEGYLPYQAKLMAGLADPPAPDDD